MKISGNEICPGMIIEHKNKLWKAIKTQHTQPGKGGAYLQVELKALKDTTKLNERFRSSESVERAILDQREFQYLYKDGDNFVFMDKTNYEQVSLGKDIIDETQALFLTDNSDINVNINFYDSEAISIELPSSVELEVEETEAVIKGQTASASYKPAILKNGLRVTVPPHIQVGMKIIVNTEDCTYVGKAK